MLNGQWINRSVFALQNFSSNSSNLGITTTILGEINMTIDKSQIETCCICKKDIPPKYLGVADDGTEHYWYEGNNALPIADGRCCDPCNQIVITDRMINLTMSRMGGKV